MSITAIQMVQAMTSISNGGEVIKPYIVKKIVDSNTKEVLVEIKELLLRELLVKRLLIKLEIYLMG